MWKPPWNWIYSISSTHHLEWIDGTFQRNWYIWVYNNIYGFIRTQKDTNLIWIILYIYPYTHDLERASGENFKRETLEKTRLTHPQSLPKRLFKFLYSLPLHCQIFERLIIKTFSHHIHFCERAVWCFGKQLGRNEFHIGWSYGQVAESGKLEKK